MNQKPTINPDLRHTGLSEHPSTRESKKPALKEWIGVKEGISEVVGLETVETAEIGFETGEIKETAGEGKKVVPGGKLPRGTGAKPIPVKPKTLVIPPVEVMQKQIAVAVKKQITLLENEARKITNNRHAFEPYALNGIIAKIRELKEILARIMQATFETLKGWWLKYVGVKN